MTAVGDGDECGLAVMGSFVLGRADRLVADTLLDDGLGAEKEDTNHSTTKTKADKDSNLDTEDIPKAGKYLITEEHESTIRMSSPRIPDGFRTTNCKKNHEEIKSVNRSR